MQHIKVRIDRLTGDAKIEAEGFTGSSCEDVIKMFTQRLGEIRSEDKKPEYYEVECVDCKL